MAKSKKKKRTTRPEGFDPNEARRQRLEARRQAKAEALAAARKRQIRDRIIRAVLILGAAAFAIWFFFLRGLGPSEIRGHPVERLSATGAFDHLAAGEPTTYETSPPVSGAHAPQPTACGVYASPIEDEVQVHNLEHGTVAIQYKPDLDPEQIKQIEEIVRSYDSHVLSAPYPQMESPITVTSWGRMMKLDSVDEPAIREYIEVFGQKAPEDVDCDNTADDSFEPAPSPTESPIIETPAPSPERSPGRDGDDRRNKRAGKDD